MSSYGSRWTNGARSDDEPSRLSSYDDHTLLLVKDLFEERVAPRPRDVYKAEDDIAGASKKPVVVVIDFGMANSGIAVGVRSSRHVTTFAPLSVPRAPGDLMTSPPDNTRDKVPTKILLCAKTHRLVAFGEKAVELYTTSLAAALAKTDPKLDAKTDAKTDAKSDLKTGGDEVVGRYMLFENVKMRLDLGVAGGRRASEITVPARCGRVLPIVTVLTEMLKHFRLTVASVVNAPATDIAWILTVPTNWRAAAQQIMLISAHAAGMPQESTGLALESESAAIMVNHWLIRQQQQLIADNNHNHNNGQSGKPVEAKGAVTAGSGASVLVPGKKCGIVDLGGGTCDATVYDVDGETGWLKNAAHSGGSWGGVQVDRELNKILDRTFGGDWMRTYEDRFPADAQALAQDIELLKHKIDDNTAAEYRLPLPASFVNYSGLAKLAPNKNTTLLLDTTSDPYGTRGRLAPADPPTPVTARAPTPKQPAGGAMTSAASASAASAAVSAVAGAAVINFLDSSQVVIEVGDERDEWEEVMRTSKKLKCRVLKGGEAASLLASGSEYLCYANEHLKWSAKLATGAFQPTVDKIAAHVDGLCADKNLATLFLVGGFSASPYLRSAVQRAVQRANLDRAQNAQDTGDAKDQKSSTAAAAASTADAASVGGVVGRAGVVLVYPPDPIKSVLVGAALYGFDPECIRSRVMRHTIGCDRAMLWSNPAHQPIRDKCEMTPRIEFDADGGVKRRDALCHGHFSAMVVAGQTVKVGDRHVDFCHPAEPGQTEMVIRFFSSAQKTVTRIDDDGVEYLGSVVIAMPVCDQGLERRVQYSIAFGGPKLAITAQDLQSGLPVKTTLSFLD